MINSKWLNYVKENIALAKKAVKTKEINKSMTANVGVNHDVEEALKNVENEDAKLYEQTRAVMTVEDSFSTVFSLLFDTATSRGIVPVDETTRLRDAEKALLAAKQAYIEVVKKIAEEGEE